MNVICQKLEYCGYPPVNVNDPSLC